MPTRQELYDRIRQSSKDEVVLEEMIRLGFWPRAGERPVDPADEIRRRGELERQLRELTAENARLQNVEALKKAARKRRMEESRRKRKETKERRLRERQERAEAWKRRKQEELLYLGDDVSGGLNHQDSDAQMLAQRGLPMLRDAKELAAAMGVSVGELRFLAFHRRIAASTHYRRFAIPKKTGGLRNISAPMPRLKQAQEWILFNILEKIELHQAAHGFRRGRSIVTNARPHVKADVVVNVDLEGFFPTVTYRRIKGLIRIFGYSEQVATILALLCSEPEILQVEIDNRTYYVAQTERYLPQGAPSSPAITNILCRGLDARLARAAESLGFTYTRYADDLTFSGSGAARDNVGRILRRVEYVVKQEGFQVHPKKTRVLRSGRRQEVTGLVVNERLGVSRETLRRFRATLFQIEKDGPAGKRWGNSGNVLESIAGFANFVAMVDQAKGAELQRRVSAIIAKYGRPQTKRPSRERWQKKPAVVVAPESARASAAPFEVASAPIAVQPSPPPAEKKKPWWKFW
jgi:retron-type reverse transcriptase